MNSEITPAPAARDWRKEHWRNNETNSEHAERVEAAEKGAAWYFDNATKPQCAAYLQALVDAAPYAFTPKGKRMRAEALRVYRAATVAAAELQEFTAEELMRDGEVSEDLSERRDDIAAGRVPSAAPTVTAETIVAQIRATANGRPLLTDAQAALVVTLFASAKAEAAA